MSARRSSATELSILILLAGCRCGGEELVVPVADGAAVAPFAEPELYVARLEALGARRLLVPWTDPTTDVAAIRDAVRGRDVELILGLTAARTFEEEWNTPGAAPAALEAAITRAQVAAETLAGVHLDHAEPGLPRDELAAHLDATTAAIRAAFPGVPLSFAIRARTIDADQLMAAGFPAPPPGTPLSALDSVPASIAWANAWAEALAGRVDRVVVHTENAARGDLATIKDDLQRLRAALAGRAELWATVEPHAALAPARDAIPPRLRPLRARDVIQSEVDVLRSHADVVLVHGAESFAPDRLLAPDAAARTEPAAPADVNLENRAEESNERLRRCCLRDGQVVSVYDHRYAPDHADNMWQEDACWITGLYTSALSFRFAVTRSPEAEAEARSAWQALHQMANTTPLKGEVVRNFSRTLYGQTNPPAAGSDTPLKHWHRAEDRELYWVGDISVDQLSGWFNGVAVYHDLVANEDEKREIAADVSAVLDLFLANDLHAVQFDGNRTRFGDLRAQPVLALAFFQIGHHITGDPRYRAEYERLMDAEGAHFGVGNVLAVYRQAGRTGSDHFYNSAFYPLVMFETDPARRAALELGFEIAHAIKRRDGDAYADVVYGVFHPDRDTWRRAARELARYRPEVTANAALAAELDALHPGPFVPLPVRPAKELDFDYVPPGSPGFRGGLEHRFSGVGFLLAYWMSRYHGLETATD